MRWDSLDTLNLLCRNLSCLGSDWASSDLDHTLAASSVEGVIGQQTDPGIWRWPCSVATGLSVAIDLGRRGQHHLTQKSDDSATPYWNCPLAAVTQVRWRA